MPDRLSALDASFLYLEQRTTPMHVGGLMTFQAPSSGEFDHEALVGLVARRLARFPRYRQKIRTVPGALGRPVWVDDPAFDLGYHVRRSALPRPGGDAQLRELVGRLQSRPLDRSRPLWELYLVEGLADGRVAIVSKTHHAMVDGISAMDAGALLLDLTPQPRVPEDVPWQPRPEPSAAELAVSAVTDLLRRPRTALEAARLAAADVQATARSVAQTAAGVLAAARNTSRAAPRSPLNTPIGEQRRYGTAATALADYKAVRKAADCTVNDVVLATVAGALRRFLVTRGEPVTAATTVRAMVPVSVRTSGQETGGNEVSAFFVDLPLGEPDPLARLRWLRAAMRSHKESGQAIGASALVGLVGLAPPSLHSLGAKLTNPLTSRIFNLVVTNVPGPQVPLYALGCRALDMYPVVPLAKGQTVSIGLTSYDGGVYYGLNADRDAMPDVEVLAETITDSLAELVAAAR